MIDRVLSQAIVLRCRWLHQHLLSRVSKVTPVIVSTGVLSHGFLAAKIAEAEPFSGHKKTWL